MEYSNVAMNNWRRMQVREARAALNDWPSWTAPRLIPRRPAAPPANLKKKFEAIIECADRERAGEAFDASVIPITFEPV